MPYILPIDAFNKLSSLRTDYEKARNIDLSVTPSSFGLPTYFGGTDVTSRQAQITFLEKLLKSQKSKLLSAEEMSTHQQWQEYLAASRFLLCAVSYVRSQLSGNSELSVLINKHFQISKTNPITEHDEITCFLTARRVLQSTGSLEMCNASLAEQHHASISEIEWESFRQHIESKLKAYAPQASSDYPATEFSQRFFGAAFGFVGVSVGMAVGDVVTQSTKALPVKTQLTALIGSTLLVVHAGGPAGFALLAPAIADRLITSFCYISLSGILGATFNVVGQGVGTGVGLPIDLAYQLMRKGYRAVGAYALSGTENSATGIRVADGTVMLHGLPLTLIDEAPPESKNVIEIKNAKVFLNGQEMCEIKDLFLPPDVLEALKGQEANQEVGIELQ